MFLFMLLAMCNICLTPINGRNQQVYRDKAARFEQWTQDLIVLQSQQFPGYKGEALPWRAADGTTRRYM